MPGCSGIVLENVSTWRFSKIDGWHHHVYINFKDFRVFTPFMFLEMIRNVCQRLRKKKNVEKKNRGGKNPSAHHGLDQILYEVLQTFESSPELEVLDFCIPSTVLPHCLLLSKSYILPLWWWNLHTNDILLGVLRMKLAWASLRNGRCNMLRQGFSVVYVHFSRLSLPAGVKWRWGFVPCFQPSMHKRVLFWKLFFFSQKTTNPVDGLTFCTLPKSCLFSWWIFYGFDPMDSSPLFTTICGIFGILFVFVQPPCPSKSKQNAPKPVCPPLFFFRGRKNHINCRYLIDISISTGSPGFWTINSSLVSGRVHPWRWIWTLKKT